MNRFDELRNRSFEAQESLKQGTKQISDIALDSKRVAGVAHNAERIIENLDMQFKETTKLTSTDIGFLFLATALQCVRQYVFSSETFRLNDKQGDRIVKDSLKHITPKATEDILFGSVPYDAITRAPSLIDVGYSTGLSGITHRYRTLGHDPILGWIFGPINIISDTLTKTDIVTTYSVYDKCIMGIYPGGTLGAFFEAGRQIEMNPYVLPAAIAKQAIHFGADYFTKQGLPIPFMGTLNPELAQTMVMKYGVDMFSITRSVLLTTLVNKIISYIHQFYYDGKSVKTAYEMRTRKIITYSNVIASSSNILYVAISKDLKKLDIGGILVTLYRLLNDIAFKKQIKQEFLEKEFYNIVMGKE